MRARKPIHEQRESFRCPAPGSRRFCELKIGSNLLPATLGDESAGGFSVLVNHPPGLSADQTAELHTDAGWFEVRVVHIAPVVPSKGNDATTAETRGQWFRLSLIRLGETRAPLPPRVSWFGGDLRVRLNQWCPSSWTIAVVGVLFTVAVVAASLALMGVPWPAGGWDGKRILRWGAASVPPRPSPSAPGSPWLLSNEPLFSDGSADAGSVPSVFGGDTSLPMSREQMRDAVRNLPGATALAIPEVVRELQLTIGQQERIHQLIEATSQAVHYLETRSQGQQRQETVRQRKQLLDEARREAIQWLTAEQRARWDQLIGER